MLKIRYLWIDKLCIIQHDKEDWTREGSKMAQIYEGSFLTIAALTSKNDRDPLFFKDETYAPSQKSHTSLMEDGTVCTVYSRIPLDYHPGLGRHQDFIDERYPLMARAWVYQERFLAPRILYFGKELIWECRETSACECSDSTQGLKHEHSLSLASGYPTSKLYLQWHKMVETYTSLRLSYESDRLPAFSGLAQQFQHRLQSTYLAGLWKDNLIADLLWFPSSVEIPEISRYGTRKPEEWRAPSWSWASVEGPIEFFRSEENKPLTHQVEVIAAECTPSSVDQLGNVSQGRLVVRGRSRPVLLNHRDDCLQEKTRHFSFKVTGISSHSITNHFTAGNYPISVDYDLIEQGLMGPNSDMSVHCLEIAGMHYTQKMYNDSSLEEYTLHPAYKSLSLLSHCVDGKTFERVGFLEKFYLNGEEARFWESASEDTFTII